MAGRSAHLEACSWWVSQHLGVGMAAAFDRLRRYARSHNLRLVEVARRTVDGGLDLGVLSSARA